MAGDMLVMSKSQMQQLAAKFLMTMKEYPPSQKSGSWNVGKMMEQLKSGHGSK